MYRHKLKLNLINNDFEIKLILDNLSKLIDLLFELNIEDVEIEKNLKSFQKINYNDELMSVNLEVLTKLNDILKLEIDNYIEFCAENKNSINNLKNLNLYNSKNILLSDLYYIVNSILKLINNLNLNITIDDFDFLETLKIYQNLLYNILLEEINLNDTVKTKEKLYFNENLFKLNLENSIKLNQNLFHKLLLFETNIKNSIKPTQDIKNQLVIHTDLTIDMYKPLGILKNLNIAESKNTIKFDSLYYALNTWQLITKLKLELIVNIINLNNKLNIYEKLNLLVNITSLNIESYLTLRFKEPLGKLKSVLISNSNSLTLDSAYYSYK